jgi:hypothetical protein
MNEAIVVITPQTFQQRRALAQNQDRAEQGQQRTCRAQRRAERQRQMLHREVSEHPGRRHDARLQGQLQMLHQRERISHQRRGQQSRLNELHRQQPEPHHRAGQGAEKQNRHHGVLAYGVFGAKLIDAEEQRGQ